MVTSVEIINEILTGNSIEGHELMKANALVEEVDEEDFKKEAVTLELQNKLDDFYHHTYQEERYVMECIRDGDVEATRERMAGNVFDTVGILSPKKINHYRYLAVIVISMATREAIAGGLSPSIAYRMSDVYVNRIDRCDTIEEMLSYMREAAIAFATEVASVKTQKALSNYTEQCRDYIYRNYHNKIYLEDIADSIGVSTGHLSRVFRADMGMSIQDYIQKFRVERAANLLKYSEAGISEISDYVCFHSQSHFGNVFKRYIGMTPGQYREKFKEKEFRSKK
jgi:AraC-like DNA-binding protein